MPLSCTAAMPAKENNYRENFARSVFLQGKIVQQTVYDLAPRIKELRTAGSGPITVYIDSPGGSIPAAEALRSLVKAPNQDGERCRLITVAIGTAASAAADFLALGDYAIAEPQAEIWYHGSRQAMDQELTFEWASWLAASLQETNEQFALRLARCSFERIIWRVILLGDAFDKYRAGTGGLEGLVDSLAGKCNQPMSKLLKSALAKQRVLQEVTTAVRNDFKRFKNLGEMPNKRFEELLLRAITKYRTRLHKKDDWQLSKTGMQEVASDFNLIHDYVTQTKHVGSLVEAYGSLFLSPEQAGEFLSKNPAERNAYLEQNAANKLQMLWYFIVSLCRLLQCEDYKLTPAEAYWIGVVDEVTGSNLLSDRELAESAPAQPAAAPAPKVSGEGEKGQ